MSRMTDNNRLSGMIPTELGSLSNLTNFALSKLDLTVLVCLVCDLKHACV
jgi:hypothetical protein